MKQSVLINCSNLHGGGGVAVASSLISCLSNGNFEQLIDINIHLLVSSSVEKNIRSLGVDINDFSSFEVVDFYGMSALWKGLGGKLIGYDAVFTVFGPAYTFRRIKKHIVGFAQPNIIYPDNPIQERRSLIDRVRVRIKYFAQKVFFYFSSSLVVELPHVRNRLLRQAFFRSKKIVIVESAVDSIYSRKDQWEPLDLSVMNTEKIKLGVVSRNYSHKNISIYPEVKRILADEFGMSVSLYVTFTTEEWNLCSDNFRENVVNVGSLRLSQCPTFYASLDGVLFPTLLECYSAVPIETFMLRKPLFVSDRAFIRDLCGTNANYFDPLSPYSVAISIWQYFSLPYEIREKKVEAAHKFVESLPGPNLRASRYLDIIRSELHIR